MSTNMIVDAKIEILRSSLNDLVSMFSALAKIPAMDSQQARAIDDLVHGYRTNIDGRIASLLEQRELFTKSDLEDLKSFSNNIKGT